MSTITDGNNMIGYFIGGFGFCCILIAIFQIGLNYGIKASIDMIGEYPAARNYLLKHKKVAKLYPYIMSQPNEGVVNE